MNVIFLDFDGVLDTIHKHSYDDIEKRISLLAEICKDFNCSIVIEASAKDAIDEETMEISAETKWVQFIFKTFEKFGINCIGRTPNVTKTIDSNTYISIWKEDEIRLYLYHHPEIDHYCILDDDDLAPNNSDLNKVRNHLVKTIYYSNNPDEEGLLPKHKNKIKKVLDKENDIKKLILRKNRLKQ